MPISRLYEENLTPIKPFPIEVLENVLFYLDLVSLLRVRRVCKTWDSAYQNLLKHRNICEVCCRREIPEQSLLQIVEKLYPMYPVKKIGIINWFLVYKSWFLWFKFEKWSALSEVCLEDYCDIKCMKLSGNWVIYGSVRPGCIQAYNLRTEEKIVIYNGMPIKDFCLLNKPSCPNEESKIFPNDKLIFFSDTYVITINLDDIADILNGSRNLTVNYHNKKDLHLSWMIQWLFTVKNSFINKMQSLGLSVNAADDNWCSKVSIMQNVRIYSSGVVQLLPLESEVYDSDDYCDVREEIRHWFQLDLNVLFGIAVRVFHVVFFIVGDKIRVLKPPDELLIIRTASLHCNVLFLGNNKGTIFAYKLKSLEDILTINLSKYTWKYKLCSEEIVSIEVYYGEEHNHSLIVASQHHIYKLL